MFKIHLHFVNEIYEINLMEIEVNVMKLMDIKLMEIKFW